MQIVCPHCTTSYAVNPANFGDAGRKVRCARCQEVWQARPEPVPAMAAANANDGFSLVQGETDVPAWPDTDAPRIESPSISGDWPDPRESRAANDSDANWTAAVQHDEAADLDETPKPSRLRSFGRPVASFGKGLKWPAALPGLSLNTACVAMGAMVLSLIVWRGDVVRLMPQTNTFFKMVGLGVNLRGLAIQDVRITTEMANNKPVLLIEGTITDITRKAIEIPRLRFIVRDAKGSDLYAWNAVLEQPSLIPGEKAWFKTRLAAPPTEGREIAVRFFHKLDLAAGGT